MTNETFLFDSKEDALKFISKCAEENIAAVLLPDLVQDEMTFYPVNVTFSHGV